MARNRSTKSATSSASTDETKVVAVLPDDTAPESDDTDTAANPSGSGEPDGINTSAADGSDTEAHDQTGADAADALVDLSTATDGGPGAAEIPSGSDDETKANDLPAGDAGGATLDLSAETAPEFWLPSAALDDLHEAFRERAWPLTEDQLQRIAAIVREPVIKPEERRTFVVSGRLRLDNILRTDGDTLEMTKAEFDRFRAHVYGEWDGA